jgi:hypothetical protein
MTTKKGSKKQAKKGKKDAAKASNSMTAILGNNDLIVGGINLSDLIPVSEAASLRDVNRKSIYELINRGRLHSVDLWGKTMVFRSEVLSFMKQKTGPKKKED